MKKGRFQLTQVVRKQEQEVASVSPAEKQQKSSEFQFDDASSSSNGMKSRISFSTAEDSSKSNSSSSFVRDQLRSISESVKDVTPSAEGKNFQTSDQSTVPGAVLGEQKRVGRFTLREVRRSHSDSSLSDTKTCDHSLSSKDLKEASTVDASIARCSHTSLLSSVFELNSTVLNRLVNIEKLLGLDKQSGAYDIEEDALDRQAAKTEWCLDTSNAVHHDLIDSLFKRLRTSVDSQVEQRNQLELQLLKSHEKFKSMEQKYRKEQHKLVVAELRCEKLASERKQMEEENSTLRKELDKLKSENVLLVQQLKQPPAMKKSGSIEKIFKTYSTKAAGEKAEDVVAAMELKPKSPTLTSQEGFKSAMYQSPPLGHTVSCGSLLPIPTDFSTAVPHVFPRSNDNDLNAAYSPAQKMLSTSTPICNTPPMTASATCNQSKEPINVQATNLQGSIHPSMANMLKLSQIAGYGLSTSVHPNTFRCAVPVGRNSDAGISCSPISNQGPHFRQHFRSDSVPNATIYPIKSVEVVPNTLTGAFPAVTLSSIAAPSAHIPEMIPGSSFPAAVGGNSINQFCPSFSGHTLNVASLTPMIPVKVESIPTEDLRVSSNSSSSNDVHKAIMSAFSQPPSSNYQQLPKGF